ETREAPDAEAAGEMALIRLAYAADLPTPDEALRMLKGEAGAAPTPAPRGASPTPSGGQASGGRSTARALEPREAPPDIEQAIDAAPSPRARSAGAGSRLASFADVVRLAGEKRDAKFRIELESYVHLISFADGRIDMRLEARAPSDLAGRLTQRLKEWTGRQWIVMVDPREEGAPTLRDARYAETIEHPFVKKAFEIFPDAEIVSIRDAPLAATPLDEDEGER
ncbi:MAG: hypothetical protein WD076_03595, partial [Parvularculaceae bacterium]